MTKAKSENNKRGEIRQSFEEGHLRDILRTSQDDTFDLLKARSVQALRMRLPRLR